MADESKAPVRLADPESEPTDEQLEQLRDLVAESVLRKEASRRPMASAAEISALADDLAARLITGEN